MFTRRHYYVIQQLLANLPVHVVDGEFMVRKQDLLMFFAEFFAIDNPRFLRDNFFRQTSEGSEIVSKGSG